MEREKLINLFKTGDFTIIYWDNQFLTIYKGRWDHDEEYEKDEYEEMEKSRIDYRIDDDYGYVPGVVGLLVQALGGEIDSI